MLFKKFKYKNLIRRLNIFNFDFPYRESGRRKTEPLVTREMRSKIELMRLLSNQ
jgi:hypothetical protein